MSVAIDNPPTAGEETSRRDRMVAPSLVIVTSPTLSTIILSRLGSALIHQRPPTRQAPATTSGHSKQSGTRQLNTLAMSRSLDSPFWSRTSVPLTRDPPRKRPCDSVSIRVAACTRRPPNTHCTGITLVHRRGHFWALSFAVAGVGERKRCMEAARSRWSRADDSDACKDISSAGVYFDPGHRPPPSTLCFW